MLTHIYILYCIVYIKITDAMKKILCIFAKVSKSMHFKAFTCIRCKMYVFLSLLSSFGIFFLHHSLAFDFCSLD